MAVAATVAVAAAVAWCVREQIRTPDASRADVTAFVDFVTGAIAGFEPEPTAERRDPSSRIRLVERLRELPELLTWDNPERVFAYTYSGAFALETIPAAFYCFLRASHDPREALLTAVNAGRDVDTVAAIAGNLVGAWCGADRLLRESPEWWSELEYRDTLVGLAEDLLRLAWRDGVQGGARCAICAGLLYHALETARSYLGMVCNGCDSRALNSAGAPAYSYLDAGDNAVFIDGLRCWRRYRHGGYITMWDEFESASEQASYLRLEQRRMVRGIRVGAVLPAATAQQPKAPMAAAGRYRGALVGLVAGDAVGTAVEFAPPGSLPPVTDMVGGGPFALKSGQWTDDTSMALCLAESLIETGTFDPIDQLRRYTRWYREGYLSSTGTCFDIGNATRAALGRFARTGEPYCGSTAPRSAGNGSIMRLAPVALAYAVDPRAAIRLAGESSRTTHAAPTTIDACRYLGALLVGALGGATKDELLAPRYSPVPGLWAAAPLHPEIDAVAAGSFRAKTPPAIRGGGYVVASLEAALWAFDCSDSFEEGCLLAVNLGDDADTTAAVYGQLAGAFYGELGIPNRWRERLALHDTIIGFADDLRTLEMRG